MFYSRNFKFVPWTNIQTTSLWTGLAQLENMYNNKKVTVAVFYSHADPCTALALQLMHALCMPLNLVLRLPFLEQFSNLIVESNQSQLSWPPAPTSCNSYREPIRTWSKDMQSGASAGNITDWKTRSSCRARAGNITGTNPFCAGKHM